MSVKIRFITYSALLAALAAVLYFIEFPLPFTPGFLKLDLSDIPAFIGALALSPPAGVAVELVKNLVHLTKSQTSGVGELANFVIGTLYVLPASLVIRRFKNRAGVFIGLAAGTVCMTLLACVMNYYVLIPFYSKIIPIDAIIKMGSAVNPAIKDVFTLILLGVTPFNIIKGIVISAVSYLLYAKINAFFAAKGGGASSLAGK